MSQFEARVLLVRIEWVGVRVAVCDGHFTYFTLSVLQKGETVRWLLPPRGIQGGRLQRRPAWAAPRLRRPHRQ